MGIVQRHSREPHREFKLDRRSSPKSRDDDAHKPLHFVIVDTGMTRRVARPADEINDVARPDAISYFSRLDCAFAKGIYARYELATGFV